MIRAIASYMPGETAVRFVARAIVCLSLAGALLLGIVGCGGSTGTTTASTTPASETSAETANGGETAEPKIETQSALDKQLQEDLLQSVIDNFNRLEDFEPGEIFPQLRDRLNQWMWQAHPASNWQRDALLSQLDPSLSNSPLAAYAFKNLETGLFTFQDILALQEAVWLRDIAKTNRGSQLDDLSIAEQLYDWTIRNIQLVEEPASGEPAAQRSPTEVLLLGRGTARERAWVFILLLRQQGLDGVMLAIPEPPPAKPEVAGDEAKPADAKQDDAKPARAPSAAPREWLPALVTDDELYLFDPWLGLPLPGAEGHRVGTLSDVAADDGLLRRLDLDAKRPYPVKAEQLDKVVAYVEASPSGLSRRMDALEGRLTGDQRVVLTSRPERIAKRLAGRPHIGEVRCWPLPYEFLKARAAVPPGQAPPGAADLVVFQVVEPLIKARALQFKGLLDGQRGAMAYYLKSRLPKETIARLPPPQQPIWETAKQDASYWLGLISFDQKSYRVAIDFFSRRTLEANPDGPWTDGAHYNLARTYEANGELAPAIELYQSDRSPQRHGNRLRARRLKAQSSPAEPNEEANP